jgi:Domain of unknown function (DUF5666)
MRCDVRIRKIVIFAVGVLALAGTGIIQAQDPQAQEQQAPTPEGTPVVQGRGEWSREGGQRPIFGKITAIKDGAFEVAQPDGKSVNVKLTAKTEFRKDRKAAKLSDFKVGDVIIVRGEENQDQSVTAQLVATRSGRPGGPGGNVFFGTLGKDFVVGEVKAINPPEITVLRPDNVTQTLELNEDTSLRKDRMDITMADIKVGDHLMARGAIENNEFVPKGVMIISPEQWQRMQQMGIMMREGQGTPQNSSPSEQQPSKPQEQPN